MIGAKAEKSLTSREFEGDRDSILMRCRETYGFVYASEWSMGLERTSCLILDQLPNLQINTIFNIHRIRLTVL
jgi:hypothetical protein